MNLEINELALNCLYFLLFSDTSQNAVILSNILDILSLCVRVHTYHIRNFVIDKNVLSRVLVLMMSSHGHLVLGECAVAILSITHYKEVAPFVVQ